MRRRGATVLVGAILLFLLLWQAGSAEVPYVELGPGPTVDTLGVVDGKPVITVEGAPTSNSSGQLRLLTVSVRSELTLREAIRGWLESDTAVVPRELIFPAGQTEKQADEESAREFKASQTSAETAALRKLGYPVTVTVTSVVPGTPADGVFAIGDVITSVDDSPVSSPLRLTELIRAKPAGTVRKFGFVHIGVARTATLTPIKADDGSTRIGVTVEPVQPHPFQLKIDLDRIGGPSAGLMFTLGIIDKLDPADLTGGLTVAGTGTMDDEGRVGPIGGIPQKLVAAKQAKAKVFLTPAANCAEAMANAQADLPLIKVATLDDALTALRVLRDHGQPALCTR
jgi:PDZ domain-containing protein